MRDSASAKKLPPIKMLGSSLVGSSSIARSQSEGKMYAKDKFNSALAKILSPIMNPHGNKIGKHMNNLLNKSDFDMKMHAKSMFCM